VSRPPPVAWDAHSHEEALQPAYDALVLRHMQGGWREEDVALAIEGLA
jgi:hypothetical protein